MSQVTKCKKWPKGNQIYYLDIFFLLFSDLLCCVINTLLWSDGCSYCTQSQRIQSINYHQYYIPVNLYNSALKGNMPFTIQTMTVTSHWALKLYVNDQ